MHSLLVFSILFVIPLICKGSHEGMCNVVPKDLFIERGSSAEIMCDTSCRISNVSWTLDKKPVNMSMSKIINATHTVLMLSQFTNHNAALQCHSEFYNEVLGGTIIRTYTKPRISSCVIHHENQNTHTPDLFTCKWEDETDSSLKRQYTLHYFSSSTPPSELCKSEVTNCTVNLNDIQQSLFIGSHKVIVRAKYAFGEVSSEHYEFESMKIRQITKPKNISLTALPDHLLVNWRISTYIASYHYRCQVRYRKAINDGTPEGVLDMVVKKQNEAMTIEGVDSCSNYTLAVRCALNEAPWSSWSQEQTILTKLNRNDYKPHLWRKVAESGQMRKVRAKWTRAPSTCQETLSYTIKQTPYEKGGSHKDAPCENSTCEMNQDAHRIHLTVLHDETVFANESVYVPAIGESLPKVTNLQTTTLNRVILVSWEAPVQPVSGYMVDYTYDGDQYKCEETNHTSVTLSDLKDRTLYNITVTPLFGDKTGDGEHALNICSRVGEPGRVDISIGDIGDKHALVRWIKPRQPCSGVVVNYTVVCHSENHTQLNLTVDGKKEKTLLEDLQPETHYSVFVVAWALTGSTRSNDMSFKTKRFNPWLSSVLSICGSLLIILVLAVGLYCAVQWKKYKEKPVPDPCHSSLAKWEPPSHKKVIYDPSESDCDQVFTEDTKSDDISPLETGEEENLNSDQTGEYAGSATSSVVEEHKGHQVQSYEIHQTSSSEETMELLSYERCPSSPYRTQSPVETPALETGKQFKHILEKKQEETPPVTVYVTLDMFKQGQVQVKSQQKCEDLQRIGRS